MKSELMKKAAGMISKLSTEELTSFARTAPVEILDVVLNELESRMEEKEFVALCQTL